MGKIMTEEEYYNQLADEEYERQRAISCEEDQIEKGLEEIGAFFTSNPNER